MRVWEPSYSRGGGQGAADMDVPQLHAVRGSRGDSHTDSHGSGSGAEGKKAYSAIEAGTPRL